MKRDFEIITKHLCLTKNIGINNAVFGGDMLSWLDNATAIFLMEKTETQNVVTVNVNYDFQKGVRVGRIVHISGQLMELGNASIKTLIKVTTNAPNTGKQKLVGEGTFTFVRIDEDGDAQVLPLRILKKYRDILKPKTLEYLTKKEKENEKTK